MTELYALTLDHLVLVLVSVAAAIILGLPMGVVATRAGRSLALRAAPDRPQYLRGDDRRRPPAAGDRLRPQPGLAPATVPHRAASICIMAEIKTSAILTVGTATLAAFIGGGGYGTLIVRGLALDDTATILAAAPAAVTSLAFHALFQLVDRLAVPRGLRREAARVV